MPSAIPTILLDTSALRSTGWDSAPFQTLMELSKAGLVEIHLPEIVYRERRSHWQERFKGLYAATTTAEKLLNDRLLIEPHRSNVSNALEALKKIGDLETIADDAVGAFFRSHWVSRIALSADQAEEAWSGYFRGSKPYKEAKNRNDIPDGFIHAAAKELIAAHKPLQCVCGDGVLSDALEALDGTKMHKSVEDLLKDNALIMVIAEWALEKEWQQIKAKVPMGRLTDEIEEFVTGNAGEFLSGKRVRSGKIPEDNGTATIQLYGDPEHVEVGFIEDWGGGSVSVPVTFTMDVSLYFRVYRADAFDVPDWIPVAWDQIDEHYLDAEGEVTISVSASVSAQVVFEAVEDESATLLSSVHFEESSLEIAILNDE
jgi:hypothetical protein